MLFFSFLIAKLWSVEGKSKCFFIFYFSLDPWFFFTDLVLVEFDTCNDLVSVILGWISVEGSGFGVCRWGIAGQLDSILRFMAFRLQVIVLMLDLVIDCLRFDLEFMILCSFYSWIWCIYDEFVCLQEQLF